VLPADHEIESIRAFGRRVGRSHPTIIQAIEEGRITAVKRDPATGKVLGVVWRIAVGEYQGNTDPTQAERSGAAPLYTSPAKAPADVSESATSSQGHQESRPAAPGPSGGGELFPGSDASAAAGAAFKQGKEDPHGYLEHRARTEQYRSKQAELEYLKDLGLLVPAVDAREANFRRYRMLRDKLLNIPDRVATILAAERDPARVHQQLTVEIKRVLSELSNDATADAAGGPAERVAA
jgi:hypothetical protein